METMNGQDIRCLSYIENHVKEESKSQLLGLIAKTNTRNKEEPDEWIKSLQKVLLLAQLSGVERTEEQVQNSLNNCSFAKCEEVVAGTAVSELCRICQLYSKYSPERIDKEKRLMKSCMVNLNAAKQLGNFLNDYNRTRLKKVVNVLFSYRHEIQTKQNEEIFLVPLYQYTFLSLLECDTLTNESYLFTNFDIRCTEKKYTKDILKSLHREISQIYRYECELMDYPEMEEVAKELLLFEDMLPCPQDNSHIPKEAIHPDEPPVDFVDLSAPAVDILLSNNSGFDDMFGDMNELIEWSADKKGNSQKENSDTSVSEQPVVIEEETEESSNEEDEQQDMAAVNEGENVEQEESEEEKLTVQPSSDDLYENVKIPKEYKCTYVKDLKTKLMFRYSAMSNLDIAVEPVIIRKQKGLLFYMIADDCYYFLPYKKSGDNEKACVNGIFSDSIHRTYTMFPLPLFYYLHILDDSIEETNTISLFDMYYAANGEYCTDAWKITRSVIGEHDLDPSYVKVFSMRYYRNVYRKFSHRMNKEKEEVLRKRSFQSHTMAFSYSLSDVSDSVGVYIHLAPEGNYVFDKDQLVGKKFKKSGSCYIFSYGNPVDKNSRYIYAFQQVLAKVYTGKLYKTYRFRLLDVSDTQMVFYIEAASEDSMLSLLSHLLVKAGQYYISDEPKVIIDKEK